MKQVAIGDAVIFKNRSGYIIKYVIDVIKGEKVSLRGVKYPQNRLIVVKISNIGTPDNPGRNGYHFPEATIAVGKEKP